MSGKKFCKLYIILTGCPLLIIGILTVVIDPFFHYHEPLKGIAYQFASGQRYVNDGITRNWNYNMIITGTSMCECFKTSEFDALWGGVSVKLTYAGARYKEINDNLKKAFSENDNGIQVIIRCLDTSSINMDKDAKREGVVYPTYLTNDNIFDDIYYLFNSTFPPVNLV